MRLAEYEHVDEQHLSLSEHELSPYITFSAIFFYIMYFHDENIKKSSNRKFVISHWHEVMAKRCKKEGKFSCLPIRSGWFHMFSHCVFEQIPVFDSAAYDQLNRFIYHFSFIDTMTTTHNEVNDDKRWYQKHTPFYYNWHSWNLNAIFGKLHLKKMTPYPFNFIVCASNYEITKKEKKYRFLFLKFSRYIFFLNQLIHR